MESDENLVYALQNAKTKDKAFRHLVTEYKEQIYWFVRKYGAQHEDADDIVQNTFLKVFKGIDNFRGDSQLSSWMIRIAINETNSFMRKKSRNQTVEYQNFHNDVPVSTSLETERIQELLKVAIDTLPLRQKETFVLKYFEDITFEEVAEIMEITVGAAKANYHHAVNKLQDKLKNLMIHG